MKKVVVVIAIVAFLAISLSLFISRDGAMAETSGEASYVSGNKCKMCHKDIFKAHAESLHAIAFENVKDAGQETNPECLACHSTGYEKPGGFVDEASTPTLAGTTCQACHGPGSAHVGRGLSKEERRAAIISSPKDACVSCHKQHSEHADVGVGTLKKKLERLQAKIAEQEG